MTLEEIKALVESATQYAVMECVEDHAGVIVVLEGIAPNGEPVNSSMMFSRLELVQAKHPGLLVKTRAREASGALDRYFESFVPAPKWDDMARGP